MFLEDSSRTMLAWHVPHVNIISETQVVGQRTNFKTFGFYS